jgi:hypothetical protein
VLLKSVFGAGRVTVELGALSDLLVASGIEGVSYVLTLCCSEISVGGLS